MPLQHSGGPPRFLPCGGPDPALLAWHHCCGEPSISPSLSHTERIINGQDTVPGLWPWQVSLQNRYGSHFCGGSLINENWVVTAAHCEFKPLLHVVILGGYDRTSRADPVQVKNVITNPDWNSYTLNNDIALLKLASPAKLGPHVSPVCLPPTDLHLPDNLQCVTTGWGRITYILADSLECAKYWGSQITSSMVCAGGAGASSCQVRSQIPAADEGVWTLTGIVSWGSGNCNVNTPTAYTRVSHFRNWIDSVVQA
uniref:Chymotrypsin like n=1 Tax=Strigops habroptila TaxID=2489341 RepID=A0A672TN09_STRHB